MVNPFPVLQGIFSSDGVEILHASMRRILRQHPMLPRFPCIQPSVDPPPYLAGFFHVPGALEDPHLKNNEPLYIPAALPDSCEFRGQSVNKTAPDSPTWRVVPLCGHDGQIFPPYLPVLVVCNAPTEVRFIVVVVDSFR